MQFLVTVDVVNDPSKVGQTIVGRITAVRVNDDNNRSLNVNLSDLPTANGRVITIVDAGTLTATIDNSNSNTNRAKNVLAGTTSDAVAAFRLVANNEAILVEDLVINVDGDTTNFASSVREVILQRADGSEIARESVIMNNEVEFKNINLVVPTGTTTIFARVVTNAVGQ